MKELARTLEKLFNGNAESRAAGMVINTMGWVEGLGYKVCSMDSLYQGFNVHRSLL
jgi:mRNA cleavage and polyadenylation factor CLP1 P-loop